jgi:hypothetical protein
MAEVSSRGEREMPGWKMVEPKFSFSKYSQTDQKNIYSIHFQNILKRSVPEIFKENL